jgi:hypothetical protein
LRDLCLHPTLTRGENYAVHAAETDIAVGECQSWTSERFRRAVDVGRSKIGFPFRYAGCSCEVAIIFGATAAMGDAPRYRIKTVAGSVLL